MMSLTLCLSLVVFLSTLKEIEVICLADDWLRESHGY